jgi:hypothetical protein
MRVRRYNRRMRSLTVIVASLLLITAALAQQRTREAREVVDPLYHVEVIVFEWVDGNRAEEDFFHGTELRHEPLPSLLELPRLELDSVFDLEPRPRPGGFEPIPAEAIGRNDDTAAQDSAAAVPGESSQAGQNPADAVLPPTAGDGPLGTDSEPVLTDGLVLLEPWAGAESGSIVPDDGAALPAGFRILEADELELGAQRARLSRRPYRLLGHAGWVQVGVDSDRAVPVDLSRLGITNPKGTIQVYVRRFLHVAVDLDFVDAQGAFWTRSSPFGLAPFEYAQRYHLEDEHNAFRLDDYVVIDHPLFNVLVRVTRAPEPEDATDAAGGRGPAP